MTNIEPAMTPDDWEEVLPSVIGSVANEHITMALANASLPDDDPRKILWTDVGGLTGIADGMERTGGSAILIASLRAVAAKLAALLPPE